MRHNWNGDFGLTISNVLASTDILALTFFCKSLHHHLLDSLCWLVERDKYNRESLGDKNTGNSQASLAFLDRFTFAWSRASASALRTKQQPTDPSSLDWYIFNMLIIPLTCTLLLEQAHDACRPACLFSNK